MAPSLARAEREVQRRRWNANERSSSWTRPHRFAPKALSPIGRRNFLAARPVSQHHRHDSGGVRAQLHRPVRSRWPDRALSRTSTSSGWTSASSTSSAIRPSCACTAGTMWAEGPGLERSRAAILYLERHPEQRAAALARGGRAACTRSSAIRPTTPNGNIFDYSGAGRSRSEHGTRRVARYELDGSCTDPRRQATRGKGLNAPNDGAAHPEGW